MEQKQLHIEILSLESTDVRFLMTGTVLAVANAFRRAMLAVPSMAIDDIQISDNTSLWTDEYLSHRLEEIPFRSTDAALLCIPEDCECQSQCPKCAVVYRVNVTNDGKTKLLAVTTNDLIHVPFKEETTNVVPLQFPIPILIVKLQEHQAFKAVVTLRKGVGKQHGKWEHSTVSMEEDPYVHLNTKQLQQLHGEQAQQLIEICPTKVFGLQTSKNGIQSVKVCDSRSCTECGECITFCTDILNMTQLVIIDRVKNKFLFAVHTNGMLDASDVIAQALQSVQERESQILADMFPLANLWKKIKPNSAH